MLGEPSFFCPPPSQETSAFHISPSPGLPRLTFNYSLQIYPPYPFLFPLPPRLNRPPALQHQVALFSPDLSQTDPCTAVS